MFFVGFYVGILLFYLYICIISKQIDIIQGKDKMERTYRKELFKQAQEIQRATGKSFAVSLAKAWQLHRFAEMLRKGTVVFSFEKADGSVRRAKGTLKGVDHFIKGTGKNNYKTFRYFDVDRQAFRSFKVENLITIY